MELVMIEGCILEIILQFSWEVEIKLEKILPIALKKFYPVCVGGNNVAPYENYNNYIDFMAKRIIKDKIIEIINWINKCKFNRKNLNDQLKQYAKGLVSL